MNDEQLNPDCIAGGEVDIEVQKPRARPWRTASSRIIMGSENFQGKQNTWKRLNVE